MANDAMFPKMAGPAVSPIRDRITQALSDIALRQYQPQMPQAPVYSFPTQTVSMPMPRERPSIPLPQERPAQAYAMQAGQPMNTAPDNPDAFNFAGPKGPQWTDAQYRAFWNRVNNNG